MKDPISEMEKKIIKNLPGGPHGYPKRSSTDFNEQLTSTNPGNSLNGASRVISQEDLLKEKLKDLYLKEIIDFLRDPDRFGTIPPSPHNPIYKALVHKIEQETYRSLN